MQSEDALTDYDLLIVDAFDDGGPAVSLLARDFFAACRRRLAADGLMAVNLWSRPKDDFPACYNLIQEAFDGNCLKLSVSESCWNTIVLGFPSARPVDHLDARKGAARALQQRCGINLPRYLKRLIWQNFKS